MIISSELTGKTYKTVSECLAAEEEYKKKKAEEEKAQKAHQEALDKAYKKAIAACDEYLELAGIEFEPKEDGYRITLVDRGEYDEIFDRINDILFR